MNKGNEIKPQDICRTRFKATENLFAGLSYKTHCHILS